MAGYARKSLTRNQRRRKVVVQKLMGIALIAICALMFWLASTGVTPEEKDCTMVKGLQAHRRRHGLAIRHSRSL